MLVDVSSTTYMISLFLGSYPLSTLTALVLIDVSGCNLFKYFILRRDWELQ